MSNEPARLAFDPLNTMGLLLRNRFIRSATLEGMAAAGGAPGMELISLYENLAKGGAGLISTSACLPEPSWAAGLPRPLILRREGDPAVPGINDAIKIF